MTDLGTLGGVTSSASAVNSAGQVVGYSTDPNEVSFAFLYDAGKMLNLNDYLPPGCVFTNLASADAISDSGQIAGSGYLADGSYHAYLMTPIGPLNILITNPPPNSVFQPPASFTISATVTDTAGTVTNVQFLVNSSVLANVSTAPWNATANGLTSGNYLLSAIAMDTTGLRATNVINVTVAATVPSAVTLLNPVFDIAGFSFSFATQPGFNYAGQYCSPLALSNLWLTFTNFVGNGSVVRITNAGPAEPERVYRVLAH
jgi:probable HAF family extracellular repeat protein